MSIEAAQALSEAVIHDTVIDGGERYLVRTQKALSSSDAQQKQQLINDVLGHYSEEDGTITDSRVLRVLAQQDVRDLIVSTGEVETTLLEFITEYLKLDESERQNYQNSLRIDYGQLLPLEKFVERTMEEALDRGELMVRLDGESLNVFTLTRLTLEDIEGAEITLFGHRILIGRSDFPRRRWSSDFAPEDQQTLSHENSTYTTTWGKSEKLLHPYMGIYRPDLPALAFLQTEYVARITSLRASG